MNKFIATAAAAFFALGSAAQATTISISTFDVAGFSSATNYNDFVIQDFENDAGFTMGEDEDALALVNGAGNGGMITGSSLNTNVGTFTTAGGIGGANQGICKQSGAPAADLDCDKLYLRENTSPTYGQESTIAVDGDNNYTGPGVWSLNANDTLGIVWDVVKGEGGSLFNRVVFTMMDAADQGATVTVTLADGTTSDALVGQDDGNKKLIVINFGELVSGATITILSSKENDSLSFDGASVGVVPLPAGGLLLLTGFGVLALRRRRKAA